MNKFSLIIFIYCLVCLQNIFSQEDKLRVAVFDPAISGKSFDEGIGVIVREMVSTSIFETGKYTIIERSLIDKILKEQKFSNSGAVDENQVSQLGKLAGADKVILCVLSSYGNKGMLSLKMIDVESAGIENQKSQLVNFTNILDVIIPLTFELIGKLESRPLIKEIKNDTSDRKSSILIEFKGVKNSRNPKAHIFVDNKSIGYGTLNEGFVINFSDDNPGKHEIRIEWSGAVFSKSYKINTKEKKQIIFDYVKSGFGYELKITN